MRWWYNHAAMRAMRNRDNDGVSGPALCEFKSAAIAVDESAVVFGVSADAQPFTSDDVRRALSEWP